MCGIIAISSNKPVKDRLIEGLKRLEYRGYDSAGIAVTENNSIRMFKSEGKIKNLEERIKEIEISGTIGIAHTRWATHGAANTINAHPHISENIAIVHNGIIENYRALKEELIENNVIFVSDTDSEVIAHLINYYIELNNDYFEACKLAFKRLEGAYAIVAIFKNNPDLIVATKKSAPLIVGYGNHDVFIGSDSYSLGLFTNKVSYLEDGDVVLINSNFVEIFSKDKKQDRAVETIENSYLNADKSGYPHYMLKEISEQPAILKKNIDLYFDNNMQFFENISDIVKSITRVNIVACGTSYHAGMVAKYWIEEYTDLAVNVDIASEFRYRKFKINKDELSIFVSQSGETADTLAALKYIKSEGQHNIALVNVKESSMGRLADHCLEIFAGIEIGVASTKAFTAQLLTFAALSIFAASRRNLIDQSQIEELKDELSLVPSHIYSILHKDDSIRKISQELALKDHILYTARGNLYPIALEAALKMKELSYIPAEALAAGELKHGTIALIDSDSIIIAIILSDALFEKTLSNLSEIKARGGKIIAITDEGSAGLIEDIVYKKIIIPSGSFTNPILSVIPAQLLSYYTALFKENDVDQPRNLAKSVTVE